MTPPAWARAVRRRAVAWVVKSPRLERAALALKARWMGAEDAVSPPIAPATFPALLAATDFVALDVGAALGLPHHWRPYQGAFDFVLVEPDEAASRKLEEEFGASGRYRIVQAALSGSGGVRPFYRLNQPTGSSMLKPALLEADDNALFEFPADLDGSSYVFPITEAQVDTITLAQLSARIGSCAFHMIKLDTQGTELEIVQGLGEKLSETVLVQMETGDHGFYREKPGLARTIAYMHGQGFSLFDLQLARNELPLRGSVERGFGRSLFSSALGQDPAFVARLWEVEAVFVRDPVAVLRRRDPDMLRRIIVALCVYRLFGEAYQLTGLGEKEGLWDGIAASRYRRDILACHHALRYWLDQGHRLFWERL
jgi:FkbM family methyltransferase